ncbi:MAG: beta-propeller domain-containing protein [Eubacteriales bacterium]
MKKTLSLFLMFAVLFSVCAGAVSAADAQENPAQKAVIMTIPSSYEYVYDRLTESLNKEDIYYYDDLLIEEPVEMEIAEEEIVMDASVSEPVKSIAMAEAAATVNESGSDADDYFRTNTQVAGIDEGDLVKTDGKYLYVLKDNGELVILSADGAASKVLSRTQVAYQSKSNTDLYDDRYSINEDYSSEVIQERGVELYLSGSTAAVLLECSRDYEARRGGVFSTSYDNYVLVKMYDVSDPAHPVQTAHLGQDGFYKTSRMTNGKIYLLTQDYVSYRVLRDPAGRSDYFSYIPSLYRSGVRELVPAGSIVCPPEVTDRTYTVISAYDMDEGVIAETKSLLTQAAAVYMSDSHLYLTNCKYETEVLDEHTESVYTVKESVSGYRTTIYKLSFGEKIVTEAVGTVDGELLNQFAMDEYDGKLRVATNFQTNSRKVYTDEAMGFTNTKYLSSDRTSGLYVFDETMNLLGSITGLAHDERIYSVRFDGKVGYFVTFRQVDPLFAVDLSDPTAPKIMSELKIPGFSEYLHPYSDTLLFGLGQDADEQTGQTYGLKLSMFDVSDPYDVFERDKLSLDIDFSSALNNHKAILISPDRGLIGFPYSKGYVLYGYRENTGFREITRITLDGVDWDNRSRGLYIGDMLYIVLRNMMVVMDMESYGIQARVVYE